MLYLVQVFESWISRCGKIENMIKNKFKYYGIIFKFIMNEQIYSRDFYTNFEDLKSLCRAGKLEDIKEYYYTHQDYILTNIQFVFGRLCECDHVDTAKWLIDETKNNKNGSINARIHEDHIFKTCCIAGKLGSAKWLFNESKNSKEGIINIHAHNEEIFRWCCRNGRLEVIKWLVEESKNTINIRILEDDAFFVSCEYNHLDVAKWLYEMSKTGKEGVINIHKEDDFAFRLGLTHHFGTDVMKWLYDLDRGNIPVSIINKYYYRICNDKKELAKIGSDYRNNKEILSPYQIEFHKWRAKTIIRGIGRILKFYHNLMTKIYQPNGKGYIRSKENFESILTQYL